MSDPELKALRWRCRRGMRELDQLLERWIDRRWEQASDPERVLFRRLLEAEDDKLWRAVLGQETLDDAELQSLVVTLTQLPH